ncbi:MAG: hypothetical protein M1827_000423 [Pycnora praestabilis]|nr:MAG: hypothetical protein M1827_000423 [Pycnora praestabilis]
MPIPVTETCIINLRGPYDLKDSSTPEGKIWSSSIETLKKCPGFRDIYTSNVVEDKTKARMFINWDSVEDHFAFYETPHFPKFREDLVSLCEVPPFPIHTVFEPAQPKTLEAPITVVYMAYFPWAISDKEKKDWESTWNAFTEKIEPEGSKHGLLLTAGGWVNEEMENAKVKGKAAKGYMGTMGWKSLDAHLEFLKSKTYADAVKAHGDFEDMEMYHVKF